MRGPGFPVLPCRTYLALSKYQTYFKVIACSKERRPWYLVFPDSQLQWRARQAYIWYLCRRAPVLRVVS